MSSVLDRLIAELRDQIDVHTARLRDGALDATGWQRLVARDLVEHHVAAYLADKPGAAVLRSADKRILADVIGTQVDYLNAFADVLEASDEWSPKYDARARSYAGALRESHSRGQTLGLPLPFHPTVGTACQVNCKCRWTITVLDTEAGDVDAIWDQAADDSCATCVERAAANPYRIRGGTLQ